MNEMSAGVKKKENVLILSSLRMLEGSSQVFPRSLQLPCSRIGVINQHVMAQQQAAGVHEGVHSFSTVASQSFSVFHCIGDGWHPGPLL